MHAPLVNRRVIPPGATVSTGAFADGWPARRFDWPGEGRGTILFLGGRGDIFEKYFEAFGHWHGQGWTIRSFDWRGQGGSGRLSASASTGHAASFAPWIDDLAHEHRALIATADRPLVVIAHSMGGHLVLRALIERRIEPAAVVMTAPMFGIPSRPFGPWLAPRLAALLSRLTRPEHPAWKANEKPAMPWETRQRLLTHSSERYQDELWWKEHDPAIALGPPSWHWVAEAYRSTRMTFEQGRIESVAVPMLIIGTDADGLVAPAAIRAAAGRLPDAELVMFGDEAAHEILREEDPVRRQALDCIDRFLDRRAPRR